MPAGRSDARCDRLLDSSASSSAARPPSPPGIAGFPALLAVAITVGADLPPEDRRAAPDAHSAHDPRESDLGSATDPGPGVWRFEALDSAEELAGDPISRRPVSTWSRPLLAQAGRAGASRMSRDRDGANVLHVAAVGLRVTDCWARSQAPRWNSGVDLRYGVGTLDGKTAGSRRLCLPASNEALPRSGYEARRVPPPGMG
jgi:hypothetical protein